MNPKFLQRWGIYREDDYEELTIGSSSSEKNDKTTVTTTACFSCPSCGAEIQSGSKACAKCGHLIRHACNFCDAVVEAEDDYCPSCGEAFSEQAIYKQLCEVLEATKRRRVEELSKHAKQDLLQSIDLETQEPQESTEKDRYRFLRQVNGKLYDALSDVMLNFLGDGKEAEAKVCSGVASSTQRDLYRAEHKKVMQLEGPEAALAKLRSVLHRFDHVEVADFQRPDVDTMKRWGRGEIRKLRTRKINQPHDADRFSAESDGTPSSFDDRPESVAETLNKWARRRLFVQHPLITDPAEEITETHRKSGLRISLRWLIETRQSEFVTRPGSPAPGEEPPSEPGTFDPWDYGDDEVPDDWRKHSRRFLCVPAVAVGPCNVCDGAGKVALGILRGDEKYPMTCEKCNGKGVVTKYRRVESKVMPYSKAIIWDAQQPGANSALHPPRAAKGDILMDERWPVPPSVLPETVSRVEDDLLDLIERSLQETQNGRIRRIQLAVELVPTIHVVAQSSKGEFELEIWGTNKVIVPRSRLPLSAKRISFAIAGLLLAVAVLSVLFLGVS